MAGISLGTLSAYRSNRQIGRPLQNVVARTMEERMGAIIFWIVFGGLAGWIASKIMGTDAQQGILLNIIVGIVGAFIGGFLWNLISPGDAEAYSFFDIGSWITAIVGACVLLFLVGMVTGRRRV